MWLVVLSTTVACDEPADDGGGDSGPQVDDGPDGGEDAPGDGRPATSSAKSRTDDLWTILGSHASPPSALLTDAIAAMRTDGAYAVDLAHAEALLAESAP